MWAIVRQAMIRFWGKGGSEFWTAEIPITPEIAEILRGPSKPKIYIEDNALIISGKGIFPSASAMAITIPGPPTEHQQLV